jgi:predicted short-subunit dehydrogenase-like oxidoreductase (DUF2520 family)
MPATVLSSSLSLVGPGRAGSALGRSWLAAGGTLADVIARDPASAGKAVARLGAGSPRGIAGLDADCDILVLAVPDDAIAAVASALAGRVRCRTAFHLSGALPASVLEALRESGAALGALHPLRVFTGSADETWRGLRRRRRGEATALGRGVTRDRARAARTGSRPSRSLSTTPPRRWPLAAPSH